MSKLTIAKYLKQDSKTLGSLLGKLQQLNQWNTWVSDCLEEKILAEHCKIVGIDRGALIVVADSPHFVTRFRFFIPGLLAKLRTYPELAGLKAICCKVRPNYMATKKPQGRQIAMPEEGAKTLREAAEKIADPKLKEVLERLANHKK